jgi:serine/threonine protein kinase
MIGSRLAHYEITRHLGSGGMGDVYQATDTRLGRSVAIKLLPDAFARDTERVARFEREARARIFEPLQYCSSVNLSDHSPAELASLREKIGVRPRFSLGTMARLLP